MSWKNEILGEIGEEMYRELHADNNYEPDLPANLENTLMLDYFNSKIKMGYIDKEYEDEIYYFIGRSDLSNNNIDQIEFIYRQSDDYINLFRRLIKRYGTNIIELTYEKIKSGDKIYDIEVSVSDAYPIVYKDKED